MLKGYFDESYDSKHKTYVVAGFVAHTEFWEDFEDNWREVMAPTGIQVFHMTDCESCHGDFKKWRHCKHFSTELITNLVSTIVSSNLEGVWAGIMLPDYEANVRGKIPSEIDNPYLFCFIHLLHQIMAKSKGLPEEQIMFVFEENNEVESKMLRAYKAAKYNTPFLAAQRHQLGECVFLPKRRSIGLQAADLLAYETQKFLLNAANGNPRPMRRSLQRLTSRINYSVPYPSELLARIVSELRPITQAFKSLKGGKL